MSSRPDTVVRGAIHDVARLKEMTGLCNVVVVSDTTLNIIQNYAIDEITYLSRFGVEFEGGYYTPVDEDHPDFDFVLDVIRRYRLEVNDLTCDLIAAINALTAAVTTSQGNQCGCDIGTDVETSDGEWGGDLPDPVNGVEYEEPSAIENRKCLASNYIHQSVRDVVNELKLNRADQYTWAGLAFSLELVSTIIGGLIAGPFGLLIGAVVGALLAMATGLFKASFSLTLLHTAITADEEGAICALYQSTSAEGAKTAYTDHLTSEGATSPEIAFVEYLLSNNVLNLLFFGWGDSEETIAAVTPTHDCSGCSPLGGCPWTFRDPYAYPTGTGDLTKNGQERTLTAELGSDSVYRVSIELDTDTGAPGEECDGGYTDNAPYQIMSYNPSTPTWTWHKPEGWVGNQWTVWGTLPTPPTQAERDAARVQFFASDAFTVNIKLFPGISES